VARFLTWVARHENVGSPVADGLAGGCDIPPGVPGREVARG
jgi:hypothetical protein